MIEILVKKEQETLYSKFRVFRDLLNILKVKINCIVCVYKQIKKFVILSSLKRFFNKPLHIIFLRYYIVPISDTFKRKDILFLDDVFFKFIIIFNNRSRLNYIFLRCCSLKKLVKI